MKVQMNNFHKDLIELKNSQYPLEFPIKIYRKNEILIKNSNFSKLNTLSIQVPQRKIKNCQGSLKEIFLEETRLFHNFVNLKINRNQGVGLFMNFVVENKSTKVKSLIDFIKSLIEKIPRNQKINFKIIIVDFFNLGIILGKNNEIKEIEFSLISPQEYSSKFNLDFKKFPFFYILENGKIISKGIFSEEKENIFPLIFNYINQNKTKDSIGKINESKTDLRSKKDKNEEISKDQYALFKAFLKNVESLMKSDLVINTQDIILKIVFNKIYTFDSENSFSISYTLPKIYDYTFETFNSKVHQLIYSNTSLFSHKPYGILVNKNFTSNALSEYFELLKKYNLKTNLILQKKESFSVKSVKLAYKIVNKEGKTNNLDINKTPNFRNIHSDLSKISYSYDNKLNNGNDKSLSLSMKYNVFKSKSKGQYKLQFKNINGELITFENFSGINHVFCIEKNPYYGEPNDYSTFLVSYQNYFNKLGIKIKFAFVQIVEEVDEEIIKVIKENLGNISNYIDFYFLELYGETKKTFDYIYEYPEASLVLIDENEKLTNYPIPNNIYLTLEKVFNLLSKKTEITKENYKKFKENIRNNLVNYEWENVFKCKPKIKICLEKKITYNSSLEIIEKKYYITGRYRILENEETLFLDLIGNKLNSINDKDIFGVKILPKLLTLNYKDDINCQYCETKPSPINLHFCAECNFYICCNCAKKMLVNRPRNPSKHMENYLNLKNQFRFCFDHFLIVFPNFELMKSKPKSIMYDDYGYNFAKDVLFENYFICSCCSVDKFSTRYKCLECFVDFSVTGKNSGYMDICEECVERLTDDNKVSKLLSSELRDNFGHENNQHAYLRIPNCSGNYFII